MTGDSSLMEAYQNLPGFGDSLGASGFFDVTADDLWDTDGEDDKGKWVPPQKKYTAEEGEKANSDIKQSSKKPANNRPSLNRKAKNLRSVSHKVNEVLSQMDESNKPKSPQEPQDEQREKEQEQEQPQDQEPTQEPAEAPTPRKSQLRKNSRSNSVTNLEDISDQPAKRDSKTRRVSSSKKKAADTSVPSKTALAELCEGKFKKKLEVAELETPKTRKARLSKKPKSLSMRDLTSLSTDVPESTSNTKKPKSKRTPQKKLTTDSISASEGGEKMRRRSSQKQSSSRELIATTSKKPRSLSMRNLTSLSTDVPESTSNMKKTKAERTSQKKPITDSMSASEGGEKMRRRSSRKKLISDSMSASEGGEKLRRRSSQKQSSSRDLIATPSMDKVRVKASTDKTDKTASTKRSSSSKKASMSASEGGVSSRRRKQDSEQKPTSIGGSSSSRTSSSKLSGRDRRKSSKKSMSVSEGAGGARRASRLTSDDSGTRATRDPVTPRSRRKNTISKKLDDMPGLQSIEEASTSAETATVVEELPKGRSPKKAVSMRSLLICDVATNAARGGKAADPKKTDSNEISSSSQSKRIPKTKLPKSMSLQDLSAVAGETEARTNKQRTKKRADSFRNLSLEDAFKKSSRVSKKTSAQSVTEGMSRLQDVSSRSTRSNPGGRPVRRNSFGSAIGPANDLGTSSIQDATPETPRTRKNRLAKAKMSLPSLQNFLGATAGTDDPFSSIDADDKSITTEIARVANGRRRRRNSVAGGQASIAQTLQHFDKKPEAPIMATSGHTQRAQNELAAESKKAVWVHRRLRALGVEEEIP